MPPNSRLCAPPPPMIHMQARVLRALHGPLSAPVSPRLPFRRPPRRTPPDRFVPSFVYTLLPLHAPSPLAPPVSAIAPAAIPLFPPSHPTPRASPLSQRGHCRLLSLRAPFLLQRTRCRYASPSPPLPQTPLWRASPRPAPPTLPLCPVPPRFVRAPSAPFLFLFPFSFRVDLSNRQNSARRDAGVGDGTVSGTVALFLRARAVTADRRLQS